VYLVVCFWQKLFYESCKCIFPSSLSIANHNVEEDEICRLASLSSAHSSIDHEDGCELGFKGDTYRDHQRLNQCRRANTPLPGNSSVPLELFQTDVSSESPTKSKQGLSNMNRAVLHAPDISLL